MTKITSAQLSRSGDWPLLTITWEGQPEPVAVVMSHPLVWKNGMVSVDKPGPTLQAFTDPADENSGTIEVENGLVAPQAAALALQVYSTGRIPPASRPIDLELPTIDEARKAVAAAR